MSASNFPPLNASAKTDVEYVDPMADLFDEVHPSRVMPTNSNPSIESGPRPSAQPPSKPTSVEHPSSRRELPPLDLFDDDEDITRISSADEHRMALAALSFKGAPKPNVNPFSSKPEEPLAVSQSGVVSSSEYTLAPEEEEDEEEITVVATNAEQRAVLSALRAQMVADKQPAITSIGPENSYSLPSSRATPLLPEATTDMNVSYQLTQEKPVQTLQLAPLDEEENVSSKSKSLWLVLAILAALALGFILLWKR